MELIKMNMNNFNSNMNRRKYTNTYQLNNSASAVSIKDPDHAQSTMRYELYYKLNQGLLDIKHGNTRPFAEAMADVKYKRNKSV